MNRAMRLILIAGGLFVAGCGGGDDDSAAEDASGGASPGSGGASSGAGGTSPGSGGATPGTGGSVPGTGGAATAGTGAGGTAPGDGGTPGTSGTGPGYPEEEPPGPETTISVSGTIDETNNVWGPGEVTLTGDVDIPEGVTLTITRGTRIYGTFGINALGGTLTCEGSYHYPATLFENWIYLRGGSHSMSFCAMNSLGDSAIQVEDAHLTLSHFQLQRFNQIGVHVRGSGASVDIDFSTLGSMAKLFTGNDASQEGVAVLIAADASGNPSSITNSVLGFLDNASNTGLRIEGDGSAVRLAYDMISGSRTDVANADVSEVFYGEPKVTDIPNLDYRLDFFSPALDLADPAAPFAAEPAPNGGRANLGYYGGTPSARITSVEIAYPNGCEELASGATETVRWKSSPNTGPKTLELSTDGGGSWQVVTNITNDTGETQVTFPSITTDQALLRISQDNDPDAIFDESNRVFAIGTVPSEAACAVEQRCPSGTAGCKFFRTICYSGYRDDQAPTGDPATEPSESQVREDLERLLPYTHAIRTYGSGRQLHGGAHVPHLADELGLALHMGVWIDFDMADDQNYAAIDEALSIIADGHPSIRTLIVGNEFLLRVRQSFGDTPSAEAKLVEYIEYAQSLAPSNINVTTGESFPDWVAGPRELFEAVDVVTWHVHPWWMAQSIDVAVQQVETAHQDVLGRMTGLGVDRPMILGETGYPWGECFGGSACGSPENQARYLDELHDYSLRTGLEYWFFTAFDEQWKSAEGAVGEKWGMWGRDRQPHLIIQNIDSLIAPTEMWPAL